MQLKLKMGVRIPGVISRGPFNGQIVQKPTRILQANQAVNVLGRIESETTVFLFIPGAGGGWTEVSLQDVEAV